MKDIEGISPKFCTVALWFSFVVQGMAGSQLLHSLRLGDEPTAELQNDQSESELFVFVAICATMYCSTEVCWDSLTMPSGRKGPGSSPQPCFVLFSPDVRNKRSEIGRLISPGSSRGTFCVPLSRAMGTMIAVA